MLQHRAVLLLVGLRRSFISVTVNHAQESPATSTSVSDVGQQSEWIGIQVASSKRVEVETVLGTPDRSITDRVSNEHVIVYDRDYYIKIAFIDDIVKDILVDSQAINKYGGPARLRDLISNLRRPSWVTWANHSNSRTVIWPEAGVYAEVVAVQNVDSDQAYVWWLRLFPPTTLDSFGSGSYIHGIPSANPYLAADPPDLAPEDPFDWSKYSKP